MRILIISDTHGRNENVEELKQIEGKFDLVIHCGDGASDFNYFSELFDCLVTGVSGNCDMFSQEPKVLHLNIEGKLIHIEHGNRLPIYNEQTLLDFAEENGYDVVLFGHTHKQILLERYGVYVINPGSISRPRDGVPSYTILTTNGRGGFKFENKRL